MGNFSSVLQNDFYIWIYIKGKLQSSNSYFSAVSQQIHKQVLQEQALTTKTYAKASSAAIPETFQEFMSFYPNIVEDLKEKVKIYDPFGGGKHIEGVLQYNLLGGKKNRGMLLYETFKRMAPVSSENLRTAAYLGWCVELFQSAYLMMDDIMDGSLYRRGKPCWYKKVGLTALNDANMLENAAYQLLKDHFSHLSCYIKLMELFQRSSFIVAVGQEMDAKATYQDVLTFTMEQYRGIALNKASDSIYLPMEMAAYLAGCQDQLTQHTKDVTMEIGIFAAIQNDYLDCYGKIEDSGATGTDIQTGKCTWLAVNFLQRANEAQKKIMKECYGKSDEASIRRVKELYNEVSLEDAYFEFEKNFYTTVKKEIGQSSEIPLQVCLEIIDKMCLGQ
uniref:Farnesyl pyrophosphate synthase n=1 Tax=Lutzomyia longipalpis TaxID=7200 RepID=A0A1B0CDU1_LUTLO